MDNNGFILVATKKKGYYEKALMSAYSLRDYWPEAKVTLFTVPELYSKAAENIFDDIVTDTPNEERGKLWACANTPYDKTFYIDADTQIEHEDIRTAFDQLGRNDVIFTRITDDRSYAYNHSNGNPVKFPGGQMTCHGGVFLYNRKALKFMRRWYELDKLQRNGRWWPEDAVKYPSTLSNWDQFALWWIMNKEEENFKYLKFGFFENDARWNYMSAYRDSLDHTNGKPRIIWHYNPTEMDRIP